MYRLLLGFLIICNSTIFSQKDYCLNLDNDEFQLFTKKKTTFFKDSLESVKYLTSLRYKAIRKGYLLASIDSIAYTSNSCTVKPFLGSQFTKIELSIQEEDLSFLKANTSINEKLIRNIPFNSREIKRILIKLHQAFENNGYPFVNIQFKPIEINVNEIKLLLVVERNQHLTFTKIHIKGDSSLSPQLVSNIIRIKTNDPFNQTKLNEISKKIKQTNYLKEIKTHELLFSEEGVELYIYIKSTPISSINGAIGLQQDPNTDKITLTGDLALKLQNTLKKGELAEFNWRSIQDQTQSMFGHLNYPFLFQSPFGVDGQFALYKRDSTFLETKFTFGIQYFLRGGNYIKAIFQKHNSSLLSGSSSNPTFSNLGTVQSINYGLAFVQKQVDYLPNPSKGFTFESEFLVGNRKAQKTDTSLVNNATTYRGELNVAYYFPIWKRHVIKIGNIVKLYEAPEIYQNELYRFGGLQNLRGFNEDQIFASTYSIFTLEYRFLIDQNSKAFLFYDQTWYENKSISYIKDFPFGFGAGFSFGTNLGIFSISYGLGKQFNENIKLKNGKIHFGYTAYF
jgi:outer membrane protein assembly factor BamA